MTETKTKGTPLRVELLGELLDQPLEDEVAILEVLTASLAKGQPNADLWSKLADASVRDDRVAELAMAFEKVLGDRRMKLFPTAAQAAACLQAARFFVDRVGDADGARVHLEKGIALAPANAEIAELFEEVLVQLGDRAGLSNLLASLAASKADPGEQLDLLRRAMKLLDGIEGQDEKAIKIGTSILKLEPGHAPTLAALEVRLGNAGKWADLAKLLEQGIGSARAAGDERATLAARRRLVEIYATKTNEIERSTAHVEAVLEVDPHDELVVSVAEKLLSHRASAARAAAALEKAYEKAGDDEAVARVLAAQLEQNRGGPKRLEIQKRLAAFHARKDDHATAWPLLEQIVVADPTDGPSRKLLRVAAESLGKMQDAAKLLSRAATLAKDPLSKALVAVEAARIVAALGDSKRAAAQIAQVLDTSPDAQAQLEAARALADLPEGVTAAQLAAALERIADGSPDAEEAADAAERLGTVAEYELEDLDRAIAAWRRSLAAGGERVGPARDVLDRLYEATGRFDDLVASLEARAASEGEPLVARGLLLKAARVRGDSAGDLAGAATLLREIGERFGPARDLHDQLMPLLAKLGAHTELAATLESEIELATEPERHDLLVELGRVRLAELGDLQGALDAHRRAIEIEPAHGVARSSLESMLETEAGLEAAVVLEPIYRRFHDDAGLVRVLEARLAAAVHPQERATLLEDLVSLTEPTEPGRALSFASAALGLALERRPPDEEECFGWLLAAERIAAAGPGPSALAAELAQALGDGALAGSVAARLSRRAAEAYEEAGRPEQAIAMARRAVAAAPEEADGDALLDRLLAERGDSPGRIAAAEEAVMRAGGSARRRDALLRLGQVSEEVGDLARAAEALERLGAEDPNDVEAIGGLVRVYEQAADFEKLCGALERARELETNGDSRRLVERKLADARVKAGRLDAAAELFKTLVESDDKLPDVSLGAAFALAARAARPELAAAVLERRVLRARDPGEGSKYAESLGELYRDKVGDASRAAEAFRTAARSASDDARREAMWSRLVAAAPDDREAAEKLVELRTATADWPGVLEAQEVLLRVAASADEALAVALAMEPTAAHANQIDRFLGAAERVLARPEIAGEPSRAFPLVLARGRAFARDPDTTDAAAAAFRRAVEDAPDDDARRVAVAELGAFLAPRMNDVARREDARTWFERRADLGDSDERREALVAWARAEAATFGELGRAAALADRVVEEFPDDREIRVLRAEWLLSLGEVDRGVDALLELRDESSGEERASFERRAAALLLELDKPREAVRLLEERLDADPMDGEALALALRAAATDEAADEAGALVERVSAGLEPDARARQLEALLASSPTLPRRRGWLEDLLACVDGERALDVAIRLAESAPEEDELWDGAEARAREVGQAEGLANSHRRVLAGLATRAAEGDTSVAELGERFGRRAVDWQEEWFQDEDAACSLMLATVRAAPEALWAFERLKLAYNAAEKWDELFELYDLVLSRTTDDFERIQLLDDAAQAARDFAQDGDRAIGYLEQLAKLRPDDGRVASSLERLYERYGRWRDLIAMLWARIDALGSEEAAKLAARVAGMWLDGARDAQSALAAIERLEKLSPKAPEIVPLLERVAAVPTAPAPDAEAESTPRQRAAAKLEVLHRAAGRDKDLSRVLQIRLEAASGAARIRGLEELVALRLGALQDEEGASSALVELVRLEPDKPSYRASLVELAEKSGRFTTLAEALESIANGTTGISRLELLCEAATLRDARAGQPEAAVTTWRTVLEEATGLGEEGRGSARRAAVALDDLLARLDQPAERCDVLERRSELEAGVDARAAALAEAARVARDELRDLPRVVALSQRRIDLVGSAALPAAAGAADMLVDGLRALARWEELVVALRLRADAHGRSADARDDRVEAASVLAGPLGRPDDAIAAWTAIEAESGRDDASAQALVALYAASGKQAELADLLESEAARATDPKKSASFMVRLGDLRRDQKEWEDALASYRLALETDPACEAAADGLRALVAAEALDRTVLRDVVGALEESYRAGGQWEALVALGSARLGVADDDGARATILGETAKILETELGDPLGASERVADALALSPGAPLAEELLRLSRAAGDFRAMARVLAAHGESRLLAQAQNGVAIELLRGAAQTAEAAGDDAANERFSTAALTRAPADVDLLERLVRARRASGGAALVDAVERLALTTGRLSAWRDAVDAARDAGDPRARALVRSTLDLAGRAWTTEPSDDEARETATWAFEVLVELAREASDHAEVRATYLRAAALPFEPDRQRELALAAADLADDDEAARILGALFDADPLDAEVASKLDEIHRRRGDRGALRALWKKRVEVAEEAVSRAAHRRELAELAAEDGDDDFAIVTLRASVEESSDAASFSRLVEILAARDKHVELCGLLEEHAARLAQQGDAARAAKLWERAAEVAELQLRALERAIGAREKSLGLAEDRTSRENLVRLLEQRGHWSRAAKSLDVLRSDALADEADALTIRLVDALARAGEVARAQALLESSAREAPPGSPLPARLAAFYREADLPGPLAALLTQTADATDDPAAQVALLREAAALHIQRLDDADGALPLLARAAELDPTDQGVRLVLAEAMRSAGRLDEAAAVLDGLLARYGNRRPKERAPVHFERGLLALAAGDRARALEDLDQAAKIDPAHPEILHALATLALEEGQLLRAQRTLRGLLMVLKPGRPEARSARGPSRAEVFFELSEIEGRNKEVARQSEMIESAFEAIENEPADAERLVVRLRRAQRPELLVRALEIRLRGDLEPQVAAPLVAELAETSMAAARPDDARAAALRAIALAPRSESVHRRAAEVLRRQDRLDAYREALSKLVEDDGEPSVETVLFAARAFERELKDDAAAGAALRRADELLAGGDLSEDAAEQRLVLSRELETIVARSGDRAALLELLERRLEPPVDAVVDDVERVATLRRMFDLRLALGSTDDEVAGVLERLVELRDDDDLVEENLRRAFDERPESARIARLLEDFARDRGRNAALVDALLRLATLDPAPMPLLREAWEVASDDGDDARALVALERGVAAAPGDADPAGEERAQWALLGLAERSRAAGDLSRAAELWERAARVALGDEARELLLRAADAAENGLGDPRRAASIYEKLREREPGDRAVWGPLAACHRKLGDDAALVELLEETLPLVDERDARNELRIELAAHRRKTDPDGAAALLDEVLDEDPQRWDAAAQLESLLAAVPERKNDLAAFLSRRLDAARDAEDKARVVELALRLGALHEELGEDQEAATAYHAGLEWEPDGKLLLRALVRLAEKRDDSMELSDALENLLRVESGPEAIALGKRLAEAREAAGDEPGAHAALLQVLRSNAGDRELFAELTKRFEARGDARALAEALSIGGQVATDPTERKQSLLEAAAALRDKAGDVPASAELLEQAFDIDPTDRDLLFQLMDARSSLGQHARAIAAVDKAMAADTEGDPWLLFSRAVLREGAGDGEGALVDLEAAYQASGGTYVAELEAQIRTCLLRADEANDAPTSRAHRVRLAKLLVAHDNLDGAASTLDEVLQGDPQDPEALQELGNLYDKLGRFAEAAEVWGRLYALGTSADPVEIAVRYADASVRSERLDEARAALERALAVMPASKPVRDRLRVLYDRLGERRGLAHLEFIEAEHATDPVVRAGGLLRGGRALLDLGEAPDRVLAAAEQAAALAPGDQDVALLQAEALSRLGRRDEASAVLEQAIAAHKGRRSPKLALIHRTAGRLALEASDPPRALEALGKAFDSDPQNAALALELGGLALQLGELDIAGRAYRSVTLMRGAAPAAPRASLPPPGTSGRPVIEGASPQDKSIAYYQLGCIAYAQRDMRRARLMLEKSLDEDPTFGAARDMLSGLQQG